MEYKTLFSYPNSNYCEDLSIDSVTYGGDLICYRISVEGMIGYESLDEAISYYEKLLGILNNWFIENKFEREENKYPPIYKTNSISIHRDGGVMKKTKTGEKKFFPLIFVYLDAPEFFKLGDTYFWLEGVINQLKTVKLDV